MTINKRLERLEQLATQATQEGDGPQVVVNLSWGDKPVIVNGEDMTQAEFDTRWPGWKSDRVVNLSWGDEK